MSRGMFHQVAHAIGSRLLFRSWAEARLLWDAVVRVTHGRVAMALMPNHIHLIHPRDVRVVLAAGLASYAQAMNHRRGEHGPLFERLPEPQVIKGEQKLRIQIRYVHLNPCRASLVTDPFAWAFSTHRDSCGLAVPTVVTRQHDAAGFHKFVSSDTYVAVDGTEFPGVVRGTDDPRLVLNAVSALTRTPVAGLLRRGPARTLFLRAAVDLCPRVGMTAIGACVDVRRNAVLRASVGIHDPAVRVVARILGDPRFAALHDRPLQFR
jgi:hypothetical protein